MAMCASCGQEDPGAAKFCARCGSALTLSCAACGGAYRSGDLFCMECGSPLEGTPAPAAEGLSQPREAPAAERRLVSVLFADIVGFTSLSESRDAEEVRELLSRYFEACKR